MAVAHFVVPHAAEYSAIYVARTSMIIRARGSSRHRAKPPRCAPQSDGLTGAEPGAEGAPAVAPPGAARDRAG